MRTALSSGRLYYIRTFGIVLILAALIVGAVGCLGDLPALLGIFAGGRGTTEDPYQIANWYHLNNVRRYLESLYTEVYAPICFILMNDLDATTTGYEELAGPTANGRRGWEPIGTSGRQFRGRFDGQGHGIRDLFIDRPDEDYVGLFGVVFATSIENVGVVNASVTGNRMVGGLVGEGYKTTASKSYFSGNVTGSEAVGGLVGSLFPIGSLENSYSTGSVSGDEYVGGLVGKGGDVTNCYVTSSVSGNSYAGGLVGGYGETWVRNSFWDVEASGIDVSDGGTGKTTAEMMDVATFTDTETEGLDEPWHIIAVAPGETNEGYTWNMVDGETYPFLSWQSVV